MTKTPVYKTPGYWILGKDHSLKKVGLKKWAVWFEKASKNGKRCVAKTEIGNFVVSTVFLGVDHAFIDDGLQLFETMVFEKAKYQKGTCDERWMERCGTWAEAEHMHRRGLRWAGCCGPYARKETDNDDH